MQTSRVIETRLLSKTYQFHRQQAGLKGALSGLIHRQYQTREAVRGVDIAVQAGEIVGLLGPNGAGKTTTLKMMTGLLRPSGGEVSVLGAEPWRRRVEFLRRISLVMGQKSMLWWDVSAMETLLLHRDMYGLSEQSFRSSVDELSELLDVRQLLDIQVRRLSLGERMKLELMVALVHRPEILFLDEPTIGLDVVAKANVRSFLADVNRQRGTTILLTSHDMDDIEALCDRVVVVTQGLVAYDGQLQDLVREVRPRKRVRVVFAEGITIDDARSKLPESTVIDRASSDPGEVLHLETSRDHLSTTLAALPSLGTLVDLDVTDPDVDEIVRDLFTSRETREVMG